MKKLYAQNIKKLILMVITIAIFSSCGKDGSVGPEGIQGEEGVKGMDGSTILSGTGSPNINVGKKGDYYLDISTTNLYGPKLENSWAEPLNLKGSKGDPGKDGAIGVAGSKIHSGKGLPLSTLGVNGDFYFDTENITFYGPKSDLNWGTPISLKSANENGVKILIIPQYKFQTAAEYMGYTSFKSISKITPTIDYHTYYENGITLIYVRDPKDPNGSWKSGTYKSYPSEVFGYTGSASISQEDFEYRSEGIFIKNTISVSPPNNGGYLENKTEVDNVISKIKNDFLIDIKIVLIPGKQVSLMKGQNINTNSKEAITNFLKLK